MQSKIKPSSTNPSLQHQISFLQESFGLSPIEIYEELVLAQVDDADPYWRAVILGTWQKPKEKISGA